VFNRRLPDLISLLFRMRRGECGETEQASRLYSQVASFILARGSKDAPYLLNSVSVRGWKPHTAKKMKARALGPDGQQIELAGEDWADPAAALSAEGRLLYDKTELLGDVPDTLRQMAARECVAIISGHEELVRAWEKAHEEWLASKAKWESDPENQFYLGLRARFDEFEQSVGGKVGKRRGRWQRYLDWLRANPDLAAWRGGPAAVVELSAGAKERIRKAKPRKVRSVEAEEFWKVNSELAALDRLHGYYEREFVRRRKTKKHPDGFDHRPTFTLPHPVRHPRWFVFNAPQTSPQGYRKLCLPSSGGHTGTVELLLLTGEKADNKYPSGWETVRFAADPRLSDFKAITKRRQVLKGKTKGQETDTKAFTFLDRQINLERPAQISGVKLIFKGVRQNHDGSLLSAHPYLVFTCNVADVPLTDGAKKIKWEDTGERRKRVVVPAGLIACAVDLGIRHVGFATVATQDAESGGLHVLRSRNIWIGQEEEKGRNPGRWSPGPDLAHLSAHKRSLRHLRGLRGKPVKGENSHIELQDHITNMASDRFKKAAREIVNFALNADSKVDPRTGEPYPRADVLVLENLANLLPDSERERGINRALIEFNRGHLADRIVEVAKDCGLKVMMVSPVGTSQVCCRCGALGRRYSLRRHQDGGYTDIHFGFVEPLFACPSCGYRANSDHNASVNLHRRFRLGEAAIAKFKEWQKGTKPERDEVLRRIEQSLVGPLREMHRLAVADTPF
jgi:hypothetical protein